MNVYWRGVDTTVDRVLSDHLLTLSVETVATTCLLYRAIHYLKRLATSCLLTFAWGITIAWFPISLLKRVMMFFFSFFVRGANTRANKFCFLATKPTFCLSCVLNKSHENVMRYNLHGHCGNNERRGVFSTAGARERY